MGITDFFQQPRESTVDQLYVITQLSISKAVYTVTLERTRIIYQIVSCVKSSGEAVRKMVSKHFSIICGTVEHRKIKKSSKFKDFGRFIL